MADQFYGDRFTGSEYYVWPRWNVRTTGWEWNESGSGLGEFYLEIAGGGAPVHPDTGVALIAPPMVEGNGSDFTAGTPGTLGLSQFGWDDNDTLGFSTLYVRLADGTDPDGKADGWVKAGGKDSGTGSNRSTAWETLKYAIETGIVTRDATNGDRVTLLSGAADNYTTAGSNITLTSYATDGSIAAPLMIQGGDAVANDRGIGHVTLASGAQLWVSGFDYGALVDFRIEGDITAAALVVCDRFWIFQNGHAVNSNATNSQAMAIDLYSSVIACYLESETTNNDVLQGSTVARHCKIVNRGNGGACEAVGLVRSLVIIEGNMPSASYCTLSSCSYSAFITFGTPNSSSYVCQLLTREGFIGNYMENFGTGARCMSAHYMVVRANSYYNVTTPITIFSTSDPAIADDPIDAGSSLFVDAAGGDFRIKKGSTDVSNMFSAVGFSDPNYSIDETFELYEDPGLGLEDTGTVIINKPIRVM